MACPLQDREEIFLSSGERRRDNQRKRPACVLPFLFGRFPLGTSDELLQLDHRKLYHRVYTRCILGLARGRERYAPQLT